MSKSRGNVVDPFDRLSAYSADGLRYYLMKDGVPHSDGSLYFFILTLYFLTYLCFKFLCYLLYFIVILLFCEIKFILWFIVYKYSPLFITFESVCYSVLFGTHLIFSS